MIYLYNQEYWEIRDLEITNTADGFTGTMNDENGNKLKDIRGIRVAGQDHGTLKGFYLHDLYVHDVTGHDAWISGADLTKPGILGKQGWDKSKRTGGILFEILEPATDEPTIFSDILIEENVINNNSFGGIITKQWKEMTIQAFTGLPEKRERGEKKKIISVKIGILIRILQ